MNYYQTLGLQQDASAQQIKQAYRKLAKQHHPDTNGGSREAEQRFKEVQEAYDTLGDPDKRGAYDDMLRSGGKAKRNSATEQQRTTGQTAGKTNVDFDINQMSQQFEQFFGFSPKSKGGKDKPDIPKKNPLDTTDLFNRYFGK
ncbi:Chaperone protein DnaJ [compost metagenome]